MEWYRRTNGHILGMERPSLTDRNAAAEGQLAAAAADPAGPGRAGGHLPGRLATGVADAAPPSCPMGHTGPWRYVEAVEAVEVLREVHGIAGARLVVDARWSTGEGFDEGLPGTGYLLCWYTEPGGAHCAEKVELPPGVPIDWD